MKRQLTLDDIYQLCLELKKRGYNLKALQVYLSNDVNSSGVHYASDTDILGYGLYGEYIKKIVRSINDDKNNYDVKQKGILIS